MNKRFLIFITIVLSVLSLATYYVGDRFIAWSPWAQAHRETVWLALGMFVVLQFLGPYLYRAFPDQRTGLFFLHWLTHTALGVFACMFFYTLVADVLGLLWRFAVPDTEFTHLEFFGVAGAVLITFVVGTVQAAMGPRVYQVEIPLAGLPAAFDGFRIAQISDLHLGPMIGVRYARRCVKMTNALAPDVIALTGDFIDGSVAQLHHAAEPLIHLKARHGKFFITGNHEYYWGVDEWLAEFRRGGATVLLNEHVIIREGEAQIVLAGVTDRSAARLSPEHAPDAARAFAGAPSGALRILLAHNPASHVEAAQAGVDLQLSGHTHGGQFFPFSMLVRLSHREYKGLYQLGRMWLYVSRGTGFWGPPLRFGIPAEITLITLRRAGHTKTDRH